MNILGEPGLSRRILAPMQRVPGVVSARVDDRNVRVADQLNDGGEGALWGVRGRRPHLAVDVMRP